MGRGVKFSFREIPMPGAATATDFLARRYVTRGKIVLRLNYFLFSLQAASPFQIQFSTNVLMTAPNIVIMTNKYFFSVIFHYTSYRIFYMKIIVGIVLYKNKQVVQNGNG